MGGREGERDRGAMCDTVREREKKMMKKSEGYRVQNTDGALTPSSLRHRKSRKRKGAVAHTRWPGRQHRKCMQRAEPISRFVASRSFTTC